MEFEQTSVARVKNLLRTLSKNTDFTPAIDKGLDMLLKEIDQNFDQQGRLYAKRGAWKPLAQVTRERRGSARPILVVSGKLKRGFKKGKVSSDEGTIENKVPYGHFHQTGGKKLPKREIIGVTDKFKKAFAVAVINQFFKGVRTR